MMFTTTTLAAMMRKKTMTIIPGRVGTNTVMMAAAPFSTVIMGGLGRLGQQKQQQKQLLLMRAMSSTAKVWVDKNTRVLCQGFTGKQVRQNTHMYASPQSAVVVVGNVAHNHFPTHYLVYCHTHIHGKLLSHTIFLFNVPIFLKKIYSWDGISQRSSSLAFLSLQTVMTLFPCLVFFFLFFLGI